MKKGLKSTDNKPGRQLSHLIDKEAKEGQQSEKRDAEALTVDRQHKVKSQKGR